MKLTPTFQPVDDRPGFTVVDPIENRQCPIQTSERVAPTPVESDDFRFPVDAAVECTTERLVLPFVVPTYVRDPVGEMLLEAEHYAYETLPDGEYLVELMAPIKLYVRVRGELTIASSDDRLAFHFDGPTTVRLGARSRHERPAATVETTAEPAALARAVSTFGSALKTTSPERSLPSFRGHPPRLALADEVRIPDGLEAPDTGIEIVVPPERAAVYAVSPLAYYLGATVETGAEPRIETDRGFTYSLDRPDSSFDRVIERLLKRAFFLDCVTRTEGFYRVDLYERRCAEDRLEVAFDGLYERSPAERLALALSMPFEAIADLVPRWRLVTYATPEPENAAVLPFLADELAIVRTATDRPSTAAPAAPLGIEEFTRASRSGEDSRPLGDIDAYVSVPDASADAFETAWLGEGVPVGANKLLQAGFENGLDSSPSSDGVEVTIVCNDSRMAAELEASDDGLYGDREELPFDVTVHRDVASDDLRALFAADVDFLHYVGHVEDGAFVCRDGTLDPSALADVGVDAFLINGCRSYEIGTRVVENGAVGGIVTLSEVGNRDAIAVGQFVARLLNNGFTLRSAVAMARSYRLVGNQYIVVGDGGLAVGQSGSVVPNSCRLESTDDAYRLVLQLYHVDGGVGAQYIPYLDGIDQHFLAGNELPPIDLSGEALARFFRLEQIVVERDGNYYWSTDDRFDLL